MWARAVALGFIGDDLEIVAGIGTLRASANSVEWNPLAVAGAPVPLAASKEEQRTREQICKGCEKYNGRTCTVAGCGCSGLGFVQHKLSKCPIGKW